MHHNICRKRTLVAIGTHDYDTVKGPFVYDARAPEEISFIPLNKTEKMDGHKLMEVYQVKTNKFMRVMFKERFEIKNIFADYQRLPSLSSHL